MRRDNPFVLQNSRVVYKNPWMQVREDRVIRPGGKEGIFGVVERGPGVTIVALDADKHIYLTLEYKYAYEQYMLECISGGIDDHETVLACAKRELREEIGGESCDWTDLGKSSAWTSTVKCLDNLFLARNTVLVSGQDTDEGEVIQIVRMPFMDAYMKVMQGEIIHAASVAAILKTYVLLGKVKD